MTPVYSICAEPIVIAHRGGGNEYPENSVTAFEAMQKRGFRFVETDVHATRDGVAVICHDPILDRISDGTGPISHYTWRELERVRDHSGNPLMRLDLVLDAFCDTIFNIDAKSDSVVHPLLTAIARTESHNRVCVASFSERRLRKVRRQLPDVATSLGVPAVAQVMAGAIATGILRNGILSTIPGGQVLQVPLQTRGIQVLTPEVVAAAHERAIAVHAWTINTLDAVDIVVSYGVDGIITDEPTAVAAHLGGKTW